MLAEHAAVAAEILPAAETVAAVAAEQSLIEHDMLADAVGRNIDPGLDNLARDLMAEDAARLAGNPAGAGEHIVVADAGSMNAHQHIVRAGLRPLDFGRLQNIRTAEVAERDGFHRGHGLNFSCEDECDRAITRGR